MIFILYLDCILFTYSNQLSAKLISALVLLNKANFEIFKMTLESPEEPALTMEVMKTIYKQIHSA